MKINIVAVGAVKEKYFAQAVGEYVKRISRFADVSVAEVSEANPGKSFEERKNIEGARLLEKCRGFIVALDGGGKQLKSRQLAEFIDNKAISGVSEISFIIGGSNGLSAQALQKADAVFSFGELTFPHQLFRVMLAEQIYRAFTILNNTPYHK
jgi:23S rRNA (pseudouridine1915-N3)-methyltransferase